MFKFSWTKTGFILNVLFLPVVVLSVSKKCCMRSLKKHNLLVADECFVFISTISAVLILSTAPAMQH